ncbi:hypothetical protein BX600DRAFT_435767 [Xylariales sp. PMI_506]|nr:hypothetical protein BX600DRAFT_435767 [Xylariales sp. PMI_506]
MTGNLHRREFGAREDRPEAGGPQKRRRTESRSPEPRRHRSRREDGHARERYASGIVEGGADERDAASRRHATSRGGSMEASSRSQTRVHHHHHHHSHHHREKHRRDRSLASVELPYSAQPLSKSSLAIFRPLLARYLEVQKNKDIDDLDEREVRGRWKSFVAKWNDGTLAEGWYDPELFEQTRSQAAAEGSQGRQEKRAPSPTPAASDGSPREMTAARDSRRDSYDEDDDEEGDDDYGPILPGTHRHKTSSRDNGTTAARHGPEIPSLQDLEVRREVDNEDRLERIAQLRLERKADRAEQKARLEELVPRAEAGTRERQLEKKREVNDKMKSFRERSPGQAAEVNETELMGGGDSIDEYKRMKAATERKKTEREIRREEIARARAEERDQRLQEYKEKEDKAMVLLKELAKQRFG